MRLMIATLCLNEGEWIEKLIDQHQDWPGLVKWAFVEAADLAYATANPAMVSKTGGSVDNTMKLLARDAKRDKRIMYTQAGLVGDGGPQGKSSARNLYLHAADQIKPDWIIVLDADEFVSYADQLTINAILQSSKWDDCLLIRHRHIWRPPSIADRPLMELEAVGAYFDVAHTRIWKWWPGMRHADNHNHPQTVLGHSLTKRVRKVFGEGAPCIVHTGFASSLESRAAKHRFYVARGEGEKDGRSMYVRSRAAWETWQPGDVLPDGGKVVPYSGPRPEMLE